MLQKDGFIWLSLAEWWFNTSYHTSLNMTPFQVLYGFPPTMVVEVVFPDWPNDSARQIRPNELANSTHQGQSFKSSI